METKKEELALKICEALGVILSSTGQKVTVKAERKE